MLNRDQIINALSRLGELLQQRGLTGELLLAGGAAMSLVHHARDMTKDVDALFEPNTIIRELARQVAEEKDLPEDWLNDGVKGYITENVSVNHFDIFNGLTVNTVATDYLLAMKLRSSRHGTQDLNDIYFLLNKLNIKSYDEAVNILNRYIPRNQILPKVRYILEEYFAK